MKKELKGFLAGVIVTAILTANVAVFAQGIKRTIQTVFNSVTIQVNGKKLEGDNITYKGVVYAPVNKLSIMMDKKLTQDSKTNVININDYTYKAPEKPFYPSKDEFMRKSTGDIVVECDKDTVYIDNKGQWHWALYFSSKDGKKIYIKEIRKYVYTYYKEYIHNEVYLDTDIKGWWGSAYIGEGETKRLGCGIGNPQDNNLYFFDYYVTGTNEAGKVIEGRCRVNLSKKVEEVTNVEASKYDTDTLRYNANYKKLVAKGVYWIPANTLGKSDLTAEDIKSLGNSPEVLKAKINTLYEVIQYLQVANFKDASDNIRMKEDGINWEHHKPGEVAITTNEGCCATSSNLLNYLLEGDYEEVGFMAHSEANGGGHVYNYIKYKGKYYIIDLTHYRNDFMHTAIENGSLDEYYSTDYILGNIHEVENLKDFANYCVQKFNKPPVLFSAYTCKNVLPIDSVQKDGKIYITYPNDYKGKVNIIYDKEGDNAMYDFAPPPTQYPDVWKPYNTVH